MRGMFADVAISNAEFVLADALPAFANGELGELGDALQVCAFFRQRGTTTMLREGHAAAWHLVNMQSAGAFTHALTRLPDAAKVTAWAKPLWDAIASGYWDAARTIAGLSRTSWNPDYEYEDDFLYVHFVLRFLIQAEPLGGAEAVLARWEEALEGGFDLRLDICRALIERDAAEFDGGLRALMAERAERVWGQVERQVITDDPSIWYPHVSVEGLALLRLATQVVGLETDVHYPQCPELARGPSPFVYDGEAWRVLHYQPTRA